MKLFNLTKQAVNKMRPRRHQLTLATLATGLLLLMLATYKVDSSSPEHPSLLSNPWLAISSFISKSENQNTAADNANPVTVPEYAVSPPVDPRLLLEVSNGDNLSILFDKAGLSAQDVLDVTSSSADPDTLTDLHPGDRLAFEIDDDFTLVSFEVIKSRLESFTFRRNTDASYTYLHVLRQPVIERVYKEAVITDSLFQAAQRGNIPDAMALELADIFGGVIDFIMDTRKGDTFSLLYEEKILDGEFIGYGKILAAQFTNQGETHTALRYENADGRSEFYNPEGESMRKTFLQNPVDFTRISSGFNLSRRHPILNTIRAHNGIDYAAPKGTPVVATADGKVTFADRNGSFGKLVVIEHGARFVTKYAHLDTFAENIRSGARVTQKQVIGYVGSTGGATGPHLHYEFLMDGTHRNFRTVFDQLPRAESLVAAEMPRFRQQTVIFVALLAGKGIPPAALAHNSVTNRQE